MAEQQAAAPEAAELAQILGEIAEKSRGLVEDFIERQRRGEMPEQNVDGQLGASFMELCSRLMMQPTELMRRQFDLWQDYMQLWHATTQRMMGQTVEPVIVAERGDRRFKDPAWNDNPLFDYIKQSYLLTARYLVKTVGETEGMDPKTQQKLEFYTRQYVDALAPSNFVMTNPEVIKTTLDTRGENLLRGLKNMLNDLERGKGRLSVQMTDPKAFKVGQNIATTPGKVVFQNELMQLIQYEPTTEQVHRRPLLIVPPWINKFYILDLQPKNSFIKFAVEQGYTVFVVSWVNPGAELAQKSFEDYMVEGPLAALDAMEQATGERESTIIGYCLGGTLTASMLSYMAVKGDDRVKATTFFTTLVDFTEPGELGVFIDEEQLASLEASMAKRGYLEGREMAHTFNLLRANDLIWSFVINNYLMGKDPFPFDLLYWNADSTRMPAAMHSFYLRKFYHENKLIEPGAITLCGVPIDLRRLNLPFYWISTKDDHIAPWRSTYTATQIYEGEKRFVLAGSGHIAGVVNPPVAKKYGYWIWTGEDLPDTPEEFLEKAEQQPGSWWPDWAAWNARFSGEMVPARQPGDGKLEAIEDAPGSYVAVQAM